MSVEYKTPIKNFKTPIREIDLNKLKTGGEQSFPFMHEETKKVNAPLVACEVLINIPDNYPELLKKGWGEKIYNPVEYAECAERTGADILALRFNIDEESEILKSVNFLKQIAPKVKIPLIITGSFRRDLDIKLLPALSKAVEKKCSIGVVEEENYKEIAPFIRDCGHNIIARTPIDINLTKQLNILLAEMDFSPDRILIDPNTSGLGYGIDYAYSIIERIRHAALTGDEMLNMPIITFVGEEAWRTKETKSTAVPAEWGDIETRAVAWESITASSMLVSGSNIIVMRHLQAIKYIKNFIKNTSKKN